MRHIIYFLLGICFISSNEHLEASSVKAQIVKEKKLGFYIELLDTAVYGSSGATDINDKGEVVGTFKDPDNNKDYAFYISTEGQLHVLDLPGYSPSGLRINNNSQIVGNISFDGYAKSFYWDLETGLTILETLGGKQTWVKDINDLGLVVGASETGQKSNLDSYPINVSHACIWKKKKIHDLGTLKAEEKLEGDSSEAISINNLGEIVGRSNYAINIGGKKKKSVMKPFYWNGTMKEIPYGDTAVAINNKSNVIVHCGLYLNGSYCTSLIWNPKKDIIYSMNHYQAVDINDHDIVIFGAADRCGSMWPPSPHCDEISYFSKGTLYLCTTFKGKDKDIPLRAGGFTRINNRNQVVGVAQPEEINESHACILNPVNTVTGIFAY